MGKHYLGARAVKTGRTLKRKKHRFTQTYLREEMNTRLNIRGVFRRCSIKRMRSILEVGCGKAREISRLQACVELIVGIDVKPYGNWKNFTQINFMVADAHYIPIKSNVFDFVFFKDVLHHISDSRTTVIKEAFRCVSNGGLLRVIEANRYDINSILVYQNCGTHEHFTRRQLYRLKKVFSFNELYGYALLPSFSPVKRNVLWNIFAGVIFLLTTWSITRHFMYIYININEHLRKGSLNYYVLSKLKLK